ncbi:unnamed protein product [Lepeophtheirus salmonis]|uniref:(salmon louse) hypothetical protein n=1 Tax=Lepeophtheirus salmonis TaxID=72036 RepID=A0A7R8H670_LEPSM|nr:unnamed protein product [Lepeophtheirus salmonis]CAF2896248.1 unnamed protein product [Lepeophtheirus salmonis]
MMRLFYQRIQWRLVIEDYPCLTLFDLEIFPALDFHSMELVTQKRIVRLAGGVQSGTCASGYGVCCSFSLNCGGMNSENCTYLVNNNPSPGACTYTICKKSNWVCRIRLDFADFRIGAPVSVATVDAGAVGDCVTDQFSVTSRNMGSPIILIVDADDNCNVVSFAIGAAAVPLRSWNIKVTQYNCDDNLSPGGPPGCLQYFTENTGVFKNYNFPESATDAQTIGIPTHLSNQMYTSCFRRDVGKCSICFTPQLVGMDVESFGLSISSDKKAAKSGLGTQCTTDYLTIFGGISQKQLNPNSLTLAQRYCGRKLNTKINSGIQSTICTFSVPFRVAFKSDADEEGLGNQPNTNEFKVQPSGATGFSLTYFQRDCP